MDKEVGGFCVGGDSLCVMGEKESRGLSPASGTAAELLVLGGSVDCCCRGERDAALFLLLAAVREEAGGAFGWLQTCGLREYGVTGRRGRGREKKERRRAVHLG